MTEIKVDEADLNKAIKDAIATAVTATLSPEAFSNFVSAILNQTDYSKRNLVEQAAIEAIRKRVGDLVEEWINQNEEQLRRQVFETLENDIGPALGQKLAEYIKGAFYLEKRRV